MTLSVFNRAEKTTGLLTLPCSDIILNIDLGRPLRDIAAQPGAESTWDFLRSCLTRCLEAHDMCPGSALDGSWFPRRLLHIDETKSPTGELSLRLVDTDEHRPKSRYLALSHCWGGQSSIRTTQENLDQLKKSVPWSDLPRTFQDCVTTARELGVWYIWIDSICIIQNDRSDWAKHSQYMDRIYFHALLTVAAVASPNSTIPFLGPEAPSFRSECQGTTVSVAAPNNTPINVRARLHRNIMWGPNSYEAEPLHQRAWAWAWQERLFSRRTISFLQQKVQWDCRFHSVCESGVLEYGLDIPLKSVVEKSGNAEVSDWHRVVEDYADRQLTFSQDRLPALSSMASQFHEIVGSEYLAGLWKEDFPRCLAWFRRELNDAPRTKPILQIALNNNVPSWSWASIKDKVHWAYYHDSNYDFDAITPATEVRTNVVQLKNCVELVGYSCKPCTDNIFGEVETGSFLELRGKVVEASIKCDIHGSGLVRRKGLKPNFVYPDAQIAEVSKQIRSRRSSWLPGRKKEQCQLRRSLVGRSDNVRIKGPVLCLLLFTGEYKENTSACVLILTPHPEHEDSYERVGIGHGDFGLASPMYGIRKDWDIWLDWEDLGEWTNWEEWFRDAKIRTLKVV